MNIKKSEKIILKLAQDKEMSVEEMRNEMQFAIDEAMQNPDPQIVDMWSHIPCNGVRPTPEEVIAYLAEHVRRNREQSELK